MEIKLNRIPLMVLAEVLDALVKTHPMRMVYYKGKVLCTTLPSSNMAF